MTLLEMLVASALSAVLLTASFSLVHTSHAAWSAQQADLAPLTSAHAAVRHIVRHIRQAQAVSALDPSGSISVLTTAGQTLVWQYNAGTDQILFGVGVADGLLAEGITDLTLAGYKADGVTPAADVDEVQLVRCDVQVALPHGAGVARNVSSWAWLRAW